MPRAVGEEEKAGPERNELQPLSSLSSRRTSRPRGILLLLFITTVREYVYYYSTSYKAVRVGEIVEDMCYKILRAEACVD